MAEDEGVVERGVVEDGDAHVERRDEAVNRREPVLALPERRDVESVERFAEPDDEHSPAVAVDQVKRAPPAREIVARGDRMGREAAGGDRAASLLQEDVERWGPVARQAR